MESASETFIRMTNNIGNKIEPSVRQHLAKVYSCLAATTICATLGAITHMTGLWTAGALSAIASLVLVLGLTYSANSPKHFYLRLATLLGFGFLSGHSLGPLLTHVVAVNPQIVVTACVATSVVFISFSAAALLAQRGSFLFLGGLLMSVLSMVTLVSLANIFMQSTIVYQAHLYLGLIIMSGFILYDTQAIMEKCRVGNNDCIKHALDLFFDIATVFRRLLVILTQKEERENNRRRKQN